MNNETEITYEEINRYKKDSEEIHKEMPPVYCAAMAFSKEKRFLLKFNLKFSFIEQKTLLT